MRALLSSSLLLGACLTAQSQTPQPSPAAPRTEFVNGESLLDTNGEHINAHGGNVIFHEGTFYWYGEARNPGGDDLPPSRGIACYTSKDLFNWKNEGLVLPVSNDPTSDIASGCIIERPKVVFNAKTGKFVLWFHLELKGQGYAAARAAVAVSDTPLGPFKFLRSLRPNAQRWPIDFATSNRTPLTPEETEKRMRAQRNGVERGLYARRDYNGGQMSRDMTIFVDDDGKGYLVSASEENYTLAIHELTPDFLDFTGKWNRIEPGGHNEAPALIKRNKKYYLLASGCTGWAPNPARVLTANSIWGPWRNAGNPCNGRNSYNGMGPEKTFGGQSTWILQVPGRRDAWIAMFDVWRPQSLITSGHIWLPVKFQGDRMDIDWQAKWNFAALK